MKYISVFVLTGLLVVLAGCGDGAEPSNHMNNLQQNSQTGLEAMRQGATSMADHTDRLTILMDDDIDKSARDDIEMYIEGHVGLKVELDKEQADMPNMHYNILKMERGLEGMNESLRTDNDELKQILPLLENGVEELNRAMTKIHQDG